MGKKILCLGLLSLMMCAIPGPASAEEVVLTREVFLEKDFMPQPDTIVRTHDDGFVIAGESERNAWATRTDSEGNVKWRYLSSATDRSEHPSIPAYHSAVVMADDSVFLCGFMSGEASRRGLLTHLDKDGKVLSEEEFSPHIDKATYPDGRAPLSEFDACLPSNDGIAAIGDTSISSPSKFTPQHPSDNFYWLLSIDRDGKTRWEQMIPMDDKIGDGLNITATPLSDDSFVFATGRHGFGSEIMQIGSNGDIRVHNIIPKTQFQIIYPVEGKEPLQLISTEPTTDHSDFIQLSLITLDNKLKETSHIEETHEPGLISQAYRLSDQSLVFFGDFKHPNSPGNAWVTWVDTLLKHEEALNLTQKGTSSFAVKAAVPLGRPGEFACVRDVLKNLAPRPVWTDKDRAEARMGIALDFISLKPSN